MNWNELKKKGSQHYKTGGVEPIDLFKAGDMLHDGLFKDIIKYAYRCRKQTKREVGLMIKDIDKIIHDAEMIKCELEEKENAKT